MVTMAQITRLNRANQAKLDQLNALARQLAPGYGVISRARLANVIKSGNTEVWIAEDDGKIIGMGVLVVYTLLMKNVVAFIEEVVVDTNRRGEGVGRAIMEKLIERAKFHKVQHIELTSRPTRVVANKMYQKLGFEQRDTNVYRLSL